MTRVAWHPEARTELLEATDYYEDEAPGLGGLFLSAIDRGLRQLEAFPAAGREIRPATRRLVVGRFPYSIVYRQRPPGDSQEIFVLAIAHQRRRPGYWADRR